MFCGDARPVVPDQRKPKPSGVVLIHRVPSTGPGAPYLIAFSIRFSATRSSSSRSPRTTGSRPKRDATRFSAPRRQASIICRRPAQVRPPCGPDVQVLFDAGQRQEIVDESGHAAGLIRHDAEKFSRAAVVLRGALQRLDEAEHGGERRAQLMARVGDEVDPHLFEPPHFGRVFGLGPIGGPVPASHPTGKRGSSCHPLPPPFRINKKRGPVPIAAAVALAIAKIKKWAPRWRFIVRFCDARRAAGTAGVVHRVAQPVVGLKSGPVGSLRRSTGGVTCPQFSAHVGMPLFGISSSPERQITTNNDKWTTFRVSFRTVRLSERQGAIWASCRPASRSVCRPAFRPPFGRFRWPHRWLSFRRAGSRGTAPQACRNRGRSGRR